MIETSPYIRGDGSHTTTPRGMHHPGTGVDEPGYLVLSTRDITRIDRLVESELIEWWAGVYGYRLTGTAVLSDRPLKPVDVRIVIESLFRTHVIPAAIAASADAAQRSQLQTATVASPWPEVPDVDVLIDPLAVAILIAQLTDGPLTSRETLEDAVWARCERAEEIPSSVSPV